MDSNQNTPPRPHPPARRPLRLRFRRPGEIFPPSQSIRFLLEPRDNPPEPSLDNNANIDNNPTSPPDRFLTASQRTSGPPRQHRTREDVYLELSLDNYMNMDNNLTTLSHRPPTLSGRLAAGLRLQELQGIRLRPPESNANNDVNMEREEDGHNADDYMADRSSQGLLSRSLDNLAEAMTQTMTVEELEEDELAEFEREQADIRAELQRREAEYRAIPIHIIIRNSTENCLLSTVSNYTVLNPPEICSICQDDLHEEVDSPENPSHPPEKELPNVISLLNCSCQAKFHFKCINHWLQNPHGERFFRTASCPNCRQKFRIRWANSDGEYDESSEGSDDDGSDDNDNEDERDVDSEDMEESEEGSDGDSLFGGSSEASSEGGSGQNSRSNSERPGWMEEMEKMEMSDGFSAREIREMMSEWI